LYYMLKNDTYFRRFDDIGYITSVGLFNDRVVDAAGAVFLSALSREPQSLDSLCERIAAEFNGADIGEIAKDAADFYSIFAEDGFIAVGDSMEKAEAAAKGFSYAAIKPGIPKSDYTPSVTRSSMDTQTLLQRRFAKEPHLHAFQIELTSRCNERCVHCYIPHENKNTDIAPELYYSVLEQLKSMGTLSLTLSGGEPMLHPDFINFLKAAKQKDFYVVVLSNLTLLNDEIVAAMKEGSVSSVQVSLYSMIPEHHDAITTIPGSFEKTKASILKLIENDIPVQISCPSMKGNINDFVDVLRWANAHKIRAFTDPSIMAMYDHETSNLANRLTPEECRKVFSDILNYDVDYQKQVFSDGFTDKVKNRRFKPEDQFCGVGVSTCCMVANGSVYPCAGWQECVCGNLYEQSLDDIWRTSEKLNWLRSLRKKDMPKCLDCENQAFCSPCLVRFANESPIGNPLEVCEHFCQVAAINKEVVLNRRGEWLLEALSDKIMSEMKKWTFKAGEGWPFNSYNIFRANLPDEEKALWIDAVNHLIRQGYIEIKPERGSEKLFLTQKGEENLFH